MSPEHTPTEIHAPRGADRMLVLFEDGHEAVYPHAVLRGFCPCAACQGHGTQIRFVEGGDLTLTDLTEVGNYALQLTWGDGHATGIYSFPYLRGLCCCARCTPDDPKQRTLTR